MLVELAGEFDIRYHKVLENVLSRCLTSGRPTLVDLLVDLSRVTFMDSQCVRELAIHYQLGGGVWLCAIPPGRLSSALPLATWRGGLTSSIRPPEVGRYRPSQGPRERRVSSRLTGFRARRREGAAPRDGAGELRSRRTFVTDLEALKRSAQG